MASFIRLWVDGGPCWVNVDNIRSVRQDGGTKVDMIDGSAIYCGDAVTAVMHLIRQRQALDRALDAAAPLLVKPDLALLHDEGRLDHLRRYVAGRLFRLDGRIGDE